MEECNSIPARVRPPTSPLSICHVLWSVEVGGAERVVLDLAKVQRAAGHRVAVLTLSNTRGALADDFRRIVDVLESVRKRNGIDLSLPLRLARWFRVHGTQIVHTHNELPLIYGAPAGRLARAVVVHSKHGIVPVTRGAHWLRRAAASTTDVFVAVSDATAMTESPAPSASVWNPEKVAEPWERSPVVHATAPSGWRRETTATRLSGPGSGTYCT